jgi:site-specific DNA recombinase
MNFKNEFSQFAKKSRVSANITDTGRAVAYTRVSSKEQAETNFSLQTQEKIIKEHAVRNSIFIEAYFGDTYESAKTDGRKEFQRMLEYVKASRGSISKILVYSHDRFSRTGGGAIKLVEDLRKNYGVTLCAITQPTDTTNPSGKLHQDINFLFGNYDNEMRRSRTIAGMKQKFLEGHWVMKPPMGYDTVRINGVRQILVNDTGRLIAKAFEWKVSGDQNELIRQKLFTRGFTVSNQTLSKIFANPFYCGKIAHGIIGDKVVDGKHPGIVSEKLFLIVNGIRQNTKGFGIVHKSHHELLPQSVFLKCSDCRQPFTGYIVKKKNIYYYKCRATGCKCNKNAKTLNNKFEQFLNVFQLKPSLSPLLEKQFNLLYENEIDKNVNERKILSRINHAKRDFRATSH